MARSSNEQSEFHLVFSLTLFRRKRVSNVSAYLDLDRVSAKSIEDNLNEILITKSNLPVADNLFMYPTVYASDFYSANNFVKLPSIFKSDRNFHEFSKLAT